MRLPWNRPDGLPDIDPAVDRLLAAARAPGEPDELSREWATLAAFRASADLAPSSRRNPVSSRRITARLATVAFAGTLGLGGVAAAYAGALPATPQQVAHDVLGGIGVPDHANGKAKANADARAARKAAKASKSPKPESSESAEADESKGPDVNGPAKAGLCNAWAASGKPKNEKSTAFANLVEAAGGVDGVEAFCADVAKPSTSPKPSKSPKPSHTAKPSKSPNEHASGRPSDAGKPSDAGRPSRSPEPDETEDSD